MKHINKGTEPTKFTLWKSQNPAASYDDLSRVADVKRTVRLSLVDEQFCLCCYCENIISINSSHIEHLQPRHAAPTLQLSYANMLASCDADGNGAHCGHKKGKDAIPINPLVTNPDANFRFAMDGQVLPNPESNQMAIDTIKTLGLDNERLKNMRRAVLSAIESIQSPADEYFIYLQNSCSLPTNGKLQPFRSAILYQLNQI